MLVLVEVRLTRGYGSTSSAWRKDEPHWAMAADRAIRKALGRRSLTISPWYDDPRSREIRVADVTQAGRLICRARLRPPVRE